VQKFKERIERKKTMNDKELEKRISRNFDRAKRDLTALKDDAVTGLSWKFEQLADSPRKSAKVAAKNLNKSIGQGLHQYNSKVQEVIDKVPGDLGKKAAGYPWVAISMSMLLGLLVGGLLRLGRNT
jgi:ElaB/YqjD/DUF883 family membrane-anchored ribosome-binding protein